MTTDSLVYAFIFAVALLISLTVHEAAHAFTAVWQGDETPRLAGRTTLNPIPHIAPLGFLLPVLGILMHFPLLFGWGKPVTVQPGNMRSPRWGHLIVALAGPLSNVLLCLLTITVAAVASVNALVLEGSVLKEAFSVMIYLNAILAVFNLLPLHPLDGSAIVTNILPPVARDFFEDYIAPYGFFLFLALLLSGKINFLFTGSIAAAEWFFNRFVEFLS